MAVFEKTYLIQPRPSPKMEEIFKALKQGWPKAEHCNQTVPSFSEKDLTVIWGLLQGCQQYMKDPWIFTDMPYHGRYNGDFEKSYWRWCYNGLHDNRMLNVPSDRFEKWNINVKPWQDGDEIVILPSSNNMTRYSCGMDAETWTNKMYEHVKANTSKKVRVRLKPRANGTSGPNVADVSIEEDLKNAHAVVTSSSLAGIDALKIGVPVFTNVPEHNPVAWCANTDFTKLNNPEYYDREHLFYNLAYKQYSIPEMRDGTCYENSKLYLFDKSR